jgi:hypothetical protein
VRMGFGVVDIVKIAESGPRVTYAYEHEGERGRFSIDRDNGESADVERELPDGKRSALLMAQHKIRQHWRAGELPDKAVWAG